MSPPIEFEIRHTEQGVRRAARALWNARNLAAWRTSMATAVIIMTIAFATRDLPWFLAIPLTAVILHAALLAWQRDRVAALMAESLRRVDPPVFRFRLDDAGLAESSAAGRVELPWSAFAGLRDADGFLLLLRAPLEGGAFIAFPVNQTPAEARLALRARFPA